MYKTKYLKCGKIYETEVEYYSYICPKCEEEKKQFSEQLKRDMARLTQLRQELQSAIANGAPQEEIDAKNRAYNELLEQLRSKYNL